MMGRTATAPWRTRHPAAAGELTLTAAEREVVERLAAGYALSEIAGELCLSMYGVYRRLDRLRARWGCATNHELMYRVGRMVGAAGAAGADANNGGGPARAAG